MTTESTLYRIPLATWPRYETGEAYDGDRAGRLFLDEFGLSSSSTRFVLVVESWV